MTIGELKKVVKKLPNKDTLQVVKYINHNDEVVFLYLETYKSNDFHSWYNIQVSKDMFNRALSTYKIVEEASPTQKNVGRVIQMMDDNTRHVILMADDKKEMYRFYDNSFVLYGTEGRTWEFVQ